MKFRKKPVVIDAVQWTGKNLLEIHYFITGCNPDLRSSKAQDNWELYEQTAKEKGLFVKTLEGKMKASIGDWIIKGVQGEIYPCKPEIFQQTYEQVESDSHEQNT